MLAAIKDRKSHPLEGSCQEAIPLPSTTFDSFFRLRCARHTPPDLRPQTHPCFPCCGVSCLCAAPVTHQAQGSLTSRSRARRLPLARSVPQKTLGSLPCPIVYSVQISWLPRGSNFNRAHGRGVANSTIRQQAICHGLRLGLIRTGGSYPAFPPASSLNPTASQTSAKGFRRLKGHEVAHHVIAGPGQLMGHGFPCQDGVVAALGQLALVKALGFWLKAHGEL